jgi:CRP/FNR family cyclic AMP-dependent transcriptional regulator
MATPYPVSLAALRSFPVFRGLPDERLEAVGRCAMMRSVPRGSAVVHAGDRTDFVYFMLTGNAKVLVSDEEGREVILTILGPGEMFGEMGVLDENPRSATVVAITPANLVAISKTDFRRLLAENFDLSLQIMRSLVTRLLLEMSEPGEDARIVTRKISKQDIAKMIGASREMVSRVMKDLQVRGLIKEANGRIYLGQAIEV